MRGQRQHLRWWLSVMLAVWFLPGSMAWGYFFDDRREMSLSGFAYSRATFALDDGMAAGRHLYQEGNMVQHRNFLTLEWRHNINRLSRGMPTVGPLFEFLNFDAFDLYANMRTEYDGVWDYGPNAMKRMMKGTRLKAPYFDDRKTATPYDGLYFTPFPRSPWPAGRRAADDPADVISLSNRRWLREFRGPNIRLFEWYFNITKGPLFIRIGRQNLSWGESDGFRLLDQINPLDNSFAGFLTGLDERRIPLNMLRAQWSFGGIGPVDDVTLEGFFSIDNEVAQPGLPTSSTNFWGSIQNGNAGIMAGRTPCGGDFMARRGLQAWNEDRLLPYAGSGAGPRNGGNCSLRASWPRSRLEDGRGGLRLTGTLHDFTFSLAHYYTYQDATQVRAVVISPTRDHYRWDLGLATDSQGRPWPKGNPWGPDDPVAARVISSGLNTTGRGGSGTVAGGERNIRSTVEYERIQVSGASLSFPVNALTGMFVGSDNPLYYLYTTFRGEVAYFRDVPTNLAYSHGDGATAIDRFLGGALNSNGGAFRPGNALADQVTKRRVAYAKRDWFLFVMGLDHNQWITWLNPGNSFAFSAQIFYTRRNSQKTNHNDINKPFGVFNDRDEVAGRKRFFQKPITNAALAARCAPGTGSRAGCSLYKAPSRDWLTTFSVSSPYLGGNLRPSFVFFYNWHGNWLLQPGVDWKFWDPFAISIRYNLLDGRGNGGLGVLNRKDNIWVEFQYQLY
ncbi:MAG: DUF1302 domain-containing protein [Deltaproteobacteria bacterium]|nr:DUF1302 domain-containing protein [Deltaproteobacteria bacterium]